jgi:hypothetical protein
LKPPTRASERSSACASRRRPGTGRRGPAPLWERFDEAVRELNHAIAGTNVRLVGRRFGELAAAAAALADAVEDEDRQMLGELRREAV